MYKLWFIVIFSYLYITSSPLSWAENIGLTDKEIIERLVRLEEGQASLNKRLDDLIANVNNRFNEVNSRFNEINSRFNEVNSRFNEVNKRIDALSNEIKDFMLWGFGITFTGIFALIGFVIWDRRTAIAPVTRSVKEGEAVVEELKRREKLVEDVLTEYSKDNPSLLALLRKKGIL